MDITSYLLGKNSAGGGGGGLDWTALGYDGTPQPLIDDYNYSKKVKDEWVPSTNLESKFSGDKKLVYMPVVDTSTATTMQTMFHLCDNLQIVPFLNTSQVTNMQGIFMGCNDLLSVDNYDTSKVTTMRQMFSGCDKLTTIPKFDTSSVTGSLSFQNMFNGANHLTDESLNNILDMCIDATSYFGTKTLYQLGLRATYYPVEKIQALPSYQDFIDAGWTIGY